MAVLRRLGALVINGVWQLGFIARFFWLILRYSGQSFTRFHLTIRELYFSGVMSLIIILVSGLFVGLVLGLQGYETLQRYGSTDALGTLVAAVAAARAGPGGGCPAVRQPCRLGGDRRNRPDESHRAAQGHGHDGGEPHRPGGRAALLGRGDLHAPPGALFSTHGHLRRLAHRGGLYRR